MDKKLDVNHIVMTANYVRYLTLMAVGRASSGHPGMPLGCAELGVILYEDFLNGSGRAPTWLARDRFTLSVGHGSMFLYALNHLYGYPITLKDIACFRRIGSFTAGHPEYHVEKGIETTTGPLGQGFANAVGLAIEAKMLAARFNAPSDVLFDYDVCSLVGDGCLMEGVSYEAASLAGHLGLDNLLAIYDDNQATIDGHTDKAFSENAKTRFIAAGWMVDEVNLFNPQKKSALQKCQQKLRQLKKIRNGKPKLLIVKTCIGYGVNTFAGSHTAHAGIPKVDDIVDFVCRSNVKDLFALKGFKDTKQITESINRQLQTGDFLAHPILQDKLRTICQQKHRQVEAWKDRYAIYNKKYPKQARVLREMIANQKNPTSLSKKLYEDLLSYELSTRRQAPFKAKASRDICAEVMQVIAPHLPQFVGGAADLVASTKTVIDKNSLIARDNFSPRDIAFGVREHAMGSVGNGLALTRLFIPFTSTFFTFFDYMKPAVRLASIMSLRHLFIFSHDSFYVGEDGPTHQPVEQLFSLRLIPGIQTFRPANDVEVAFSFLYFLENNSPSAIVTTRQALATEAFTCVQQGSHYKSKTHMHRDRAKLYQSFKQGAYVLATDEDNQNKSIDIILLGSGSEVGLLLQTKILLNQRGLRARVVSVPCLELFEASSKSYREKILHLHLHQSNAPTSHKPVPILVCEAASYLSLSVLFYDHVSVISVNRFGFSSNMKDLAEQLGFTAKKSCKNVCNY